MKEEEEEEEEVTADIKSNIPHLTGGESPDPNSGTNQNQLSWP